jgi:hypothetical protein
MKLQREAPNRPYAVCRGRFDRWHIYEHTINGWHWIASFRFAMT